ncbi:MAG: xanthine dehydrogenase molybdopterin binding subunit [Oceanospirillaceae bacterium]|nr:xanthine dehydrogenase molybdopterin binding subunit [Oceanospirillaceae bacterium]
MSNASSPKLSQAQMLELINTDITTGVGKKIPHEAAERHVTGEALYIDDRVEFANQLHLYPVLSEVAHGLIKHIDISQCKDVAGVECVMLAQDIPGNPDIGPVLAGDPLMAADKVEYIGQVIAVVVATSHAIARRAAALVKVDISPLKAILQVKEAHALKHYVLEPHTHTIGNANAALANATHKLKGEFEIGGQEHFYLETQICSTVPTEEGGMLVYSSTQHPSEVQKLVAQVIDVPLNKISVDMRRMGGGFGGKETQAAQPACLAALASHLTNKPCKMRLERKQDMCMTGKRHPFIIQYQVGFDQQGLLSGLKLDLLADCGYSPDLSGSIVDRAMFHSDNAYYLGNAIITGYRCKTNRASNTAYRGFGGPQGMVAIESIMDHIARFLNRDPLSIRKLNYYQKDQRNITHYGQKVEGNLLEEMTAQLELSSDYDNRRQQIIAFNKKHPFMRKGMALTPVKFGISFTATFLNQGGALINIYTDGSIQLNHGGTEMGQGLNTKVAQVVAEEFQVDIGNIVITATHTDKVPNTSPTAASSGADINGKAAQNAARTIKSRLIKFAQSHYQVTAAQIRFVNNHVVLDKQVITFVELIQQAYFGQISLSSTGFYRTPKIFYDRDKAHGTPFYYFAFGMACSEVIIDTLTGEYKVLRTDILHDVGDSLNPRIDLGQVEGAFVQGMGWMTTEELKWDDSGRLLTCNPMSYKIPAITDTPNDFRVKLVENRKNPEDTVYHSKAVGEPPFMLGISVWCALKDAVASLGDYKIQPIMNSPATPEVVLFAAEKMRREVADV